MTTIAAAESNPAEGTAYAVIFAVAFCHMLNDMMQSLIPGRVGMVSGLFFGFSFGMGGLGAAAIGMLADNTSIEFVYRVCAFLPAIGLLAAFLPSESRLRALARS